METILQLFQFACTGFWTFIGVYLLSVTFLFQIINFLVRIYYIFMKYIAIIFRGWPVNDDEDKLNEN